ncbi:hypothetical protein JK200_11305 [Gluconobacter cerinus]|nr:hypothetical protein [Gluconobacter cerinus]
MMRPLHPILRGHTDQTFAEYLSDRPLAVQQKARERRVCMVHARARAADASIPGIAKAYAATAEAVEAELVALLHATKPAEVIPFPEPPMRGPQTMQDLLMRTEAAKASGRLAGFLRFCTDLLPGGRHVH